MSTLARPVFPAPLAAPFQAIGAFLLHLRDSWALAQAMREEARRKYPYLEF